MGRIFLKVSSDSRGVGKTTLAVKLLQANPDFLLLVNNPQQQQWITQKFDLPPSQSRRIILPDTNLVGMNETIIIDDRG